MATSTIVVYVALLGEGTQVWRPVDAIAVAEGIYQLSGEIPEGESWQFAPDSQVRCVPHVFPDGMEGLVAVELQRAFSAGDILAEVVLEQPTSSVPMPSPIASYGFIVSFGGESFSSAVLPSGSGHLVPGVAVQVQLKFLFPEAAQPYLQVGTEFSFFEQGRIGHGRVVLVPNV